MKKKRDITFSIHNFDEDTTARAIEDWQAAGVAQIWEAMREMTVLSYALRGIDIADTPLDKSVFIKRTVPWNEKSSSGQHDD